MSPLINGGRVLHLIRHAQSNWNVNTGGEHVGARPTIVDVDSRLSEVGVAQAPALSLDAIAPPPQLIISSPLSRALATAVALAGDSDVEIRAEPFATEWCENSCDVGRPSTELKAEYAGLVKNIGFIGMQWWPLTQEEIAAGGRETEASVDERVASLLAQLQLVPHTSIALVSHCMLLQKVEMALTEAVEPSYLANAEVRTVALPDNMPEALKFKAWQKPNQSV